MVDLIVRYNSIKRNLQKIDFAGLWAGFHEFKFALYNKDLVCLAGEIISKTDDFMANTSIVFNDEHIAIWNIGESGDIDDITLTSKIVHEMFHAFQMENDEIRYANEIGALMNYVYSVENLNMKHNENKLIVDLVNNYDILNYRKLLELRKKRLELHNYEVNYEALVEQIEGSANYVELMTLKQLDIKAYDRLLSEMQQDIVNIDKSMPIRIISYYIGALLIKILQDNHIDMIDYGFVNDAISIQMLSNVELNDIVLDVNPKIATKVDSFYDELREYIYQAIIQNNVVLDGSYKLIGLNIYDARKYREYLTSTYFLGYQDDEGNHFLNGNYVIKMNNSGMIEKVYEVKEQE